MNSQIPEDVEDEIKRLVDELNYHCYLYYALDNPRISDSAYDTLYLNLKNLEEKYNYILQDSPTQRVGHKALERFEKVKHNEPMLSLANAFSFEDVFAFDKRLKKLLKSEKDIEYTVEPKYDGLAIEINYKSGIFIKASTRGDGYEGEDVTENIKTIKSLPLKIQRDIPDEIDIRGEVYMNISDLERLNDLKRQKGDPLFSNPRNAAAGSVRQLDATVTSFSNLHISCYGAGFIKGLNIKTQSELIDWQRKNYFPVPFEFRIAKGIDKVLNIIQEIEAKRDGLKFEIDGVVIKINDFELQKTLGVKTKEPYWAIAYKFPAKRAITKIIDVIQAVGRTGVITPVAILEPVKIGGVTVSRSTLHNWQEIKGKDICIKDTVEIERAGDVIPHITKVLIEKRIGDETIITPPLKCPVCDSTVMQDSGEVAIRCIGLNCPMQAQKKIAHFASRQAMNIEGLGDKNIELLYSAGLINCFLDIYKLREADLLNLNRFAKKSAQKLIISIEQSKHTTLAKFIYALGIRHVGEFGAKLLAKDFKEILNLFNIPQERILQISQIGEKTAEAISGFFRDDANLKTLNKLLDLGLTITNPDFKSDEGLEILKGKKIVITGTLPKSRQEIEELIEKSGGITSSSVSKNIDYLLIGEKPGSKLQKAQGLGIRIIGYEEFLTLTKLILL